jgi:uncharacterized protein (DUF1501 family)
MISRRQFLRNGSSALVAGAISPVLSAGSRRDSISRRSLVVVELNGGNDALNTVIPVCDDRYYAARPTLAIPRRSALMLDGDVGLHPSMTAMRELYEKGKLAIIQGVGYPNSSRSHFRSMDVWHRGDTAEAIIGGWLGRAFGRLAGAESTVPALHFGRSLPHMFAGPGVRAVSVSTSDDLFPTYQHAEPVAVNSNCDGLERGCELVRRAMACPRAARATYPMGRLGEGLALFAQMIVEDAGTRLFYISVGGFDTHARQADSHGTLLRNVSAAVGAFVRDLEAEGRGRDVMVMMFSEFGRRLKENTSAGTDHGTAGVMFVAGGSVRGGVYGARPSLSDMDGPDLNHTTDFRGCYATLAGWLGIQAKFGIEMSDVRYGFA